MSAGDVLDRVGGAGNGCISVPAASGLPVAAGDTSDEWAAPAFYYANVSGVGGALKASLATAMTVGHRQARYGDFRSSAALHDADPDQPGNILLAYNRASVSANWDSGATWNREHVWPQSRQPGSASNSTRGHLGDPHALRPVTPFVNGSRGNDPYGNEDSTGGYGSVGAYFFPGDADKGDIARSQFYSATRYASSGLTLTDGFPFGNQMGDLSSLVVWHYLDPPDEFEMRRNHVIYSQAFNPFYYTNNRNAFVDLPGAVWSVYVDNQNDSRLWVGSSPDADGGSSEGVCLRVLEGVAPPAVELVLNRDGSDGTYYAVVASGDAVTDQPLHNGFSGAFAIGDATPKPMLVGIDPGAVSGPGLYSGVVTIDNLDMTNGGGAGRGELDQDDVVNVTLESVAASVPSLDGSSIVETVFIDAGDVPVGAESSVSFPLYAIETVAGFTAGVEFVEQGIAGAPSSTTLSLPSGAVAAGESGQGTVVFTSEALGDVNFVVTIGTSDESSVFGGQSRGSLTVVVAADIVIPCVGDTNGDNIVSAIDISTVLGAFGNSGLAPGTGGDVTGDGSVTALDISQVLNAFGTTCP